MTGIFQGFYCLPVKNFRTLFPDRTAGEACLAEPTATDTATEHFQIRPVMDDLGGRNDHLGRIVSFIQILHDPLGELGGNTIHQRNDLLQCAILIIMMLVKAGNIYAVDLGNFQQELFLF